MLGGSIWKSYLAYMSLIMCSKKKTLAVESRDLSWQNPYNRVFFAQVEFFGKHFFSEKLLFTQAQTFCKKNPLNPLRFTSHQRNWDKDLQFYQEKLFGTWHIWQNWCFVWFYHSKICKIEKYVCKHFSQYFW